MSSKISRSSLENKVEQAPVKNPKVSRERVKIQMVMQTRSDEINANQEIIQHNEKKRKLEEDPDKIRADQSIKAARAIQLTRMSEGVFWEIETQLIKCKCYLNPDFELPEQNVTISIGSKK